MSADFVSALLSPRAVAVYGSVSAGKLGAVLIERIVGGGFNNVYAVNPKAAGLGDVKGYMSASDVPIKLDLAVIATPAPTVAGVLADAGKAGVRAAVIISSGFGEAGHPELEQEIKSAAKEWGIRYIGPNCAGMIDLHAGLYATLEEAPMPGRVSFISQSGALGGLIMSASKRGMLGIGRFLSYGNGSDLNETELVRLLADDEATDVIAMYLENVKDGRPFIEALAYATSKKPVVILKSGRTAGGARAALSHTGALAGTDSVYDAAFRKCGAVRVDTADELLDVCRSFSIMDKPRGKRVLIVTNSGGPGVLCADACDGAGLLVPAPDDELKARFTFLPAHAGLANPIDVTVEGTAEQYEKTLETALEYYDAAIVIYVGTPYLKALPTAQGVANAAKRAGKPVMAMFTVGSDIAKSLQCLSSNGIPCFDSAERAAAALGKMEKLSAAGRLDYADANAHIGERPLEPEAMRLLKEAGLPVPPNEFAKTKEQAAQMAGEIGYPVCMKIVAKSVIHKSDVGGVKLNIANADEARAAFDSLKAIAPDFEGAIVYPMLKKGLELIMGGMRDRSFGPVVLFGLGGVTAEALKDISFAIAPINEAEAQTMLDSIKAKKLLHGFRGSAALDIGALKVALVRLSELMCKYEDVAEVDLNPVIAYENGASIADARIITLC